MKVRDFYDLVELKREPEATLLPNLQYRTQKYPFFQPDIFIYIKCLYLSNSEDFADELTRLAPFVSDRKALFYYVMNDRYKHFQKRAEKRLMPDRTEMLISAFFEGKDEQEDSLDLENLITGAAPTMATSDYFTYLNTLDENQDQNESDSGKSISEKEPVSTVGEGANQDDFIEINLEYDLENDSIGVDISDDILEDENDAPQLKHHDIIDSFLAKAANDETFRITLEPGDSGDEVLPLEEDDDQAILETEDTPQNLTNDYFFIQTLATIYIKQKKYERAYEIIKHLSLNYPEKNIYFADQLSFLEKLIKNSNKK